jgi:cytochrome c-type biogenesis protein CcmH/NrfG
MYSEGTDRVRDSLTEAAESYQRGQEALRTKQLIEAIAHLTRAVKLDPHVFEYAALLAWAQYLGAPSSERKQTTEKVRKLLNHAIQKSSDPERARFHLGELEKMLGRDAEALALFKVVAKANPDHVEALAEVQELEAKLANKSSSSGGWFRKR